VASLWVCDVGPEQASDGGAYATPLEYMVTPPDGDCLYDDKVAALATNTTLAYITAVAAKYTADAALIHFTDKTVPSDPSLAKSALPSLVAASKEAKDADPRFGRGLTSTYTEAVKRSFYKASIITSEIEADSFSEYFKAGVFAVVKAESPVTQAWHFVNDFGNFVMDRALMGAELYRTLYTQSSATDTAIQRMKAAELFGDMNALVGAQDLSSPSSEVLVENDKSIRFEMSKIFRVGETALGDKCDVGGNIYPQVSVRE
jgi:hypothetical protein